MTERLPLADDLLPLPEWLRAPLYLGESAWYYAALESHTHVSDNVELVLTAFDPSLWDDIWRIDLDTDDSAGNVLILFSLLADRDFRVLAAETSVNSFSKNHTTTVIVSAARYSSDRDLDQAGRLRIAFPKLSGLRSEILSYLGDQIAFRQNGTPRLKINHMRGYRQLSDDLRSGARFTLNRPGAMLSNGAARLTPRAKDHLQKAVGAGPLSYSPAVDTKDRMIRVLFYADDHHRKHYLQAVIADATLPGVPAVLGAVYAAGGNVVRNNIRPTPFHVAHRLMARPGDRDLYPDELNCITVDLTFDLGDGVDPRTSLAAIDAALDQCQHDRILFINKKSW